MTTKNYTADARSAANGDITIISDGLRKYPVLTADLAGWVADHGPITAENYERFITDVNSQSSHIVGTIGCIAECEALAEAGAHTHRTTFTLPMGW